MSFASGFLEISIMFWLLCSKGHEGFAAGDVDNNWFFTNFAVFELVFGGSITVAVVGYK